MKKYTVIPNTKYSVLYEHNAVKTMCYVDWNPQGLRRPPIIYLNDATACYIEITILCISFKLKS